MTQGISYNRLKNEKSAYLQQHKNQPVHWWPYGPEAILQSANQDRPIFLSIGYSSCHWCHVMAHESFENEEVANYLNENFICIKVDREEYPDLDQYYQMACQAFSQTGGWPLSAFLLPDMRPFFCGTYFPAIGRKGLPSFSEVLAELTRAFREEREKVILNATQVCESIAKGNTNIEKVQFDGHFPDPNSIMEATKSFRDNENGGFGNAPKFPQFSFWTWAVEQILEGMIPQEHGEFVIKSIEKMLMGGLYDGARGGIHRYSTDDSWTVPHFEKMLYDQAGLLSLLSKLSLIYPSPLVFDAIINTLEYLKNEMMSDDHYFFSAQDADAEGVEGLYHTFALEEFEDALNASDDRDELEQQRETILKWFNISQEGNFERGLNVISLSSEYKDEIFTKEGWGIVRKTKKALLKARKGRIPPMTDTKGVASWNFLTVEALVDVMTYCQIDVIKRLASSIFNEALEGVYNVFVIAKDSNGMRIRHTTTKDNTLPYLEDYVSFAKMQSRVYEVTGNSVFKNNFLQTLAFIKKEFMKDSQVFTRALSTSDHHLYPNQKVDCFDSSFVSPSSELLGLLRRAQILLRDADYLSGTEEWMEEMTHHSLRNPLNSGGALKALTYPPAVYKSIRVPSRWTKEAEFLAFLPYFLGRFVWDYHLDKNEKWEICHMSACELNGEGLKNFIETLRPAKNQDKK